MQDGPRAPTPDPAAAPTPRGQERAPADSAGELRYRQLFESSPLPLWVYDLETLRFLDVNEVACARYGWSREEFLAMSILDIRPPEDARAVMDSVRDTPPSVFSSGVWRHRIKSGDVILVEITSHEMTFMGRHTRFVCPIDVTQRVRNEERLARHAEELEERVRQRTAELLVSNRELAQATAQAQQASIAKSRFLSTVSHELRTPLNAILGFAQLLTLDPSRTLSATQQATYGGHIADAGRHLLDLINELLDLAAIEAGKTAMTIEPLALGTVLADCLTLILPIAAPRGIVLRGSGGELPGVLGDRTRLKQVLINLLSNAVKYSPEHTVVDIACQQLGDMVRLSVVDHGAGMTPEQVAALYQPFNRLGREAGATQGSGIGLVVTKGLIELMNGRIGVDSIPGTGSTFWIELPAAAELPANVSAHIEAVARPASVEAAADAPAVTVLCVDDDLPSLRLIEHLLAARPGTRVLTATNGRIGVELARRHLPTVIVMDNNMPEMTGREARALLRADPATARIPIIALSANAPGSLDATGSEGVFRAIPKPFEVDPVLDAIDQAIAAALSRRAG